MDDNKASTVENDDSGSGMNALVDLSDEDLLEVIEEFALMSDQEMEDAFSDVMKALGAEHDPEIAEAMREVMAAAKSLSDKVDEGGGTAVPKLRESLVDTFTMLHDKEQMIADATSIALEMISGSDWKLIHDKRGEILESLIVAGRISAGDAALYRSDDDAWEKELRSIWDGLQQQATKEEL